MKNVVISLLNYNGRKNTIECLKSLRNIKKENFKLNIVIADNSSTDDSVENIKDYIKSSKHNGVELIENKKNLGFSGGHNVVIEYALKNKADYVLILNNDTYVDENFLLELVEAAGKNKDAGILVPKIYFAPGYEFHKDKYSKNDLGKVFWYAGGAMDWANIIGYHRGVDEVDKGQFNKVEETEIATGCCMLITREVFEKIDMPDDKYFLYYEDADLSMKAKNSGFKILYIPRSVIWHKNAGSTGGSGSKLQDYYITRNRLVFGFRYAPIRTKLALIRESIYLVFKGRQWQKKGIVDFYLNKLGKGSFNL